MSINVQLGAVGVVFVVEAVDADGTAVDYSDATTKTIIFGRPGGTSATQTAIFTTTGADGKIQYTTIAGDLNTFGEWSIQGRFQKTGLDVKTALGTFMVRKNI